MKSYMLEVCVDSMESALAAIRGGAKRLELCQDLIVGGTTPSIELLRMIKEVSDITIHVLIRPRFGDFLYTEYEYQRMCREIKAFANAGADGVVIGSLRADGSLHEEQMKGMIAAAGDCKITMHRAFDVCADPFAVLEQAKKLGIHNILTSGQEKSCLEGADLLAKLVKAAGNEIKILGGAGINPDVIAKLHEKTGITDFHMSGKVTLDSGMMYRNPRVSMGMPGLSEFEIWQTAEENVKKAIQVLETL